MKVPYDRPTKLSWSSPRARRITSMSWATSTLPRWPSRSPSVARHSSATALAAVARAACSAWAVGSEVRGVERRNRVAARDRGALTHAARVEADDVEPVAHLGADLEPSGHAPHAGGAGSARVHHQCTDPLARDVGGVADQRQVERRTARVLVAHRDGEGGAVEAATTAVPVERDGLGQGDRGRGGRGHGGRHGGRGGRGQRPGRRRRGRRLRGLGARRQRDRQQGDGGGARAHPDHARRVPMPLTFGVFIPQGWKMELASIEDPQAKWAKAVEVAVLAEELGLDSLWTYDHFHNVPVPAHETMFECWTTLAAISQRTSRIMLGQMVGCAPYRNPGLLAKITSNIDVISGGRLIWGIGAGWYEHEFKGYGYEFMKASDRIRVLRETVEIVKAMWTEPDVSYDGKHFQLDGAQCDPKPVQRPAPADPHRRRRRAAHAARRRPARRRVQLRRQAARVQGQDRGAPATLQRGRARLRRDPEDVVAGDLHPRDRGRGRRRPAAARSGASRSSHGRRATSSARPSRSRRRSSSTSTSAAPASTPGAATTPRPRRSACSPRRSYPS